MFDAYTEIVVALFIWTGKEVFDVVNGTLSTFIECLNPVDSGAAEKPAHDVINAAKDTDFNMCFTIMIILSSM